MMFNRLTKIQDNRSGRYIILAAFVLFFLNFVFRFPGLLTPDSIEQYRQAVSGQFTDWHPPLMALTWSILREISDGPETMLAAQLLGHWTGFALLANGLNQAGRHKAAWLILFCGGFPFFNLNGVISKDVLMASTLIIGFSVIFYYRAQGLRPPLIATSIAVLSVAYGGLLRSNAVFAFPPLLLYAFAEPMRLGPARFVLISCVLSVAAIPISAAINHGVFGAEPSGVVGSLQLFDLVGIASETGDLSVMPPTVNITEGELEKCYTPIYWDPFAPWGLCKSISEKLGPPNSKARKEMTGLWVNAILSHPIGYVEHRLKNFNISTNFFVPALPCRFAPRGSVDCPPVTAKDIRWDYIKNNPLRWSVTWIVVGLSVGVLLWPVPTSAYRSAAYVLLMSGLGYALAYVVVGVSGGYRYFYWTVMSVTVAVIIVLPLLVERIKRFDYMVVISASFLILIISAAYFARLTEEHILIRPG